LPFQGGLSAVVAKFPPSYMGAMIQGQGLGGLFAASVNVLVLFAGAEQKVSTNSNLVLMDIGLHIDEKVYYSLCLPTSSGVNTPTLLQTDEIDVASILICERFRYQLINLTSQAVFANSISKADATAKTFT